MIAALTVVDLRCGDGGVDAVVSDPSGSFAIRAWPMSGPLAEPAVDEHLAAVEGRTAARWLPCADVLVLEGAGSPWAGRAGAAAVVAIGRPDGTFTLVARNGWAADLVLGDLRESPPGTGTVALIASFVHAWWVSGGALTDLEGTVLSMEGRDHRVGGGSAALPCIPGWSRRAS